jgi:hypothetical protein
MLGDRSRDQLPDRSPVSLVLRCLPAPAAEGALVGQVEVVETGEVLPVRDLVELVALVQRVATDRDRGAR